MAERRWWDTDDDGRDVEVVVAEDYDALAAENERLRAKHRELHRRCQEAEAAIPDYARLTALPPNGDGVRFVSGSLGRALLASLAAKQQEEIERLRSALGECCAYSADIIGHGIEGTVFELAARINDVAHEALAGSEFRVCGDEGCDKWPDCRCARPADTTPTKHQSVTGRVTAGQVAAAALRALGDADTTSGGES